MQQLLSPGFGEIFPLSMLEHETFRDIALDQVNFAFDVLYPLF